MSNRIVNYFLIIPKPGWLMLFNQILNLLRVRKLLCTQQYWVWIETYRQIYQILYPRDMILDILLHVVVQVQVNDILGIIRRLHEVSHITIFFITRTYHRWKGLHHPFVAQRFGSLSDEDLRTIIFQNIFWLHIFKVIPMNSSAF